MRLQLGVGDGRCAATAAAVALFEAGDYGAAAEVLQREEDALTCGRGKDTPRGRLGSPWCGRVRLSDEERRCGAPTAATARRALTAFVVCGVVRIEGMFEPQLAHNIAADRVFGATLAGWDAGFPDDDTETTDVGSRGEGRREFKLPARCVPAACAAPSRRG